MGSSWAAPPNPQGFLQRALFRFLLTRKGQSWVCGPLASGDQQYSYCLSAKQSFQGRESSVKHKAAKRKQLKTGISNTGFSSAFTSVLTTIFSPKFLLGIFFSFRILLHPHYECLKESKIRCFSLLLLSFFLFLFFFLHDYIHKARASPSSYSKSSQRSGLSLGVEMLQVSLVWLDGPW